MLLLSFQLDSVLDMFELLTSDVDAVRKRYCGDAVAKRLIEGSEEVEEVGHQRRQPSSGCEMRSKPPGGARSLVQAWWKPNPEGVKQHVRKREHAQGFCPSRAVVTHRGEMSKVVTSSAFTDVRLACGL